MEKLRITFQSDGTELPLIEKIKDDKVLRLGAMTHTDLQRMFIEDALDHTLFSELARRVSYNQYFFDNFQEFIENYKPEYVTGMINAIISLVGKDRNVDNISELFSLFLTNLSEAQLSQDKAVRLLRTMMSLSKLHKFNSKELSLLLTELLEKSNYWDQSSLAVISEMSNHILQVILQQANQDLAEKVSIQLVASAPVELKKKLAKEYVEDGLITGVLPLGTIHYKQKKDEEEIILYVPPHRRDVNYVSSEIKQVGHPGLMFKFILNGQKITEIYLFAVKDRYVSLHTKLYHFPFSNVFGNGELCMPGKPTIKNITQLGSVVDIVLDAERNGHLFQNKGVNFRDYLMDCSYKDFDESQLVATNMIVENIL